MFGSTVSARERIIFLGILGILFWVSLGQNLPEIADWNYHFGAEYGNIAASITRGEGYGSPFEKNDTLVNTGPSAWMAPVPTYLVAIIFTIFGVKTPAAVWAFLALKYVALSVTAVLLFRICMDTSRANWPYLILPIYGFHIRYSFDAFFTMTHDAWLGVLVVAILLYAHHRRVERSAEPGWGWGVLGGIAILVNPVLGPVFLVLTFLHGVRGNRARRLLVVLVAGLVVAPWMVRNYLVFDRLVPVKSNLFFDLYQSNYLDEDGILDKRTFADFHPYENLDAFEEYASLGEVRFMDKYRSDFLSRLRAEPGVFVRKSFNRVVAIFLRFPIFETQGELWGWSGKVKLVTYSFPFLFAVFLLLSERGRRSPVVKAVIVVYALYVLPYFFVGFYRRYRLPLIPVFSLLYFFAAVRVAEMFPPRRILDLTVATWRWWKTRIDLSGRRLPEFQEQEGKGRTDGIRTETGSTTGLA